MRQCVTVFKDDSCHINFHVDHRYRINGYCSYQRSIKGHNYGGMEGVNDQTLSDVAESTHCQFNPPNGLLWASDVFNEYDRPAATATVK